MDKIVSIVVGALLAGVTVIAGTGALSAEGKEATAGEVTYADA